MEQQVAVKKDFLGMEMWFLGEMLHREDGPAVIHQNGIKEWWQNGKRHREDGPAVENVNDLQWWKHGLLHREDGPAIIYNKPGEGIQEFWFLEGIRVYKD